MVSVFAKDVILSSPRMQQRVWVLIIKSVANVETVIFLVVGAVADELQTNIDWTEKWSWLIVNGLTIPSRLPHSMEYAVVTTPQYQVDTVL